jgi:hypothetical protein
VVNHEENEFYMREIKVSKMLKINKKIQDEVNTLPCKLKEHINKIKVQDKMNTLPCKLKEHINKIKEFKKQLQELEKIICHL